MEVSEIVHCDIKPPNMLLERATDSTMPSRLKLIDFGEANKFWKADSIEVGTPGYMAPEVRKDGDCSFASDVYSAGVSLVELWNGGIWAGAETRGDGFEGMRNELMEVILSLVCIESYVYSQLATWDVYTGFAEY